MEPDTLKNFEKKLSPIIHIQMIKQGFHIKNKNNHEYIKNTLLGHQVVSFDYDSYYGKRRITFSAYIMINMVHDIYKKYKCWSIPTNYDLHFSSHEIVREDIDFSTKEGIKIFLDELQNKLFSILAYLENNIKDINKLLEDDNYDFFMSYFYKERIASAPFFLIAAHLANSPKLNDVFIKFSKARIKTINPEDLSTLVNNLEKDINPHSFMSLYETLLEQRKAVDKNKAEFLMTMLPPQEELELLKTAWYDESTGLIWQIGCIGEQVCNENPTGVADLLTWQEVLELLKQPKYKHWRLPTKEELVAVEITQHIMCVANNQIASYPIITDKFIYHWTSNIKQFHDL